MLSLSKYWDYDITYESYYESYTKMLVTVSLACLSTFMLIITEVDETIASKINWVLTDAVACTSMLLFLYSYMDYMDWEGVRLGSKELREACKIARALTVILLVLILYLNLSKIVLVISLEYSFGKYIAFVYLAATLMAIINITWNQMNKGKELRRYE